MILNQKAAVRCITNSRYNAHTGPLFKKLGILPFENLVQFFQLKFMHQIRNNLAPRSFHNTWTLNLNRDILLRNENDFQVPPTYSEIIVGPLIMETLFQPSSTSVRHLVHSIHVMKNILITNGSFSC